MKKSVLTAVVNYLKDVPEMAEAYAELRAELDKFEEKARAQSKLYEDAKAVVMACVTDKPKELNALFEESAKRLPEGFTKAKLQYALTNYWADEVERTKTGRNPYTYTKKA